MNSYLSLFMINAKQGCKQLSFQWNVPFEYENRPPTRSVFCLVFLNVFWGVGGLKNRTQQLGCNGACILWQRSARAQLRNQGLENQEFLKSKFTPVTDLSPSYDNCLNNNRVMMVNVSYFTSQRFPLTWHSPGHVLNFPYMGHSPPQTQSDRESLFN